MDFPNFTDSARLLLIAPHPDDESLACSVILQRAARAGAAVRVVYATDGEDNPWPQRFLDRKWRLDVNDRTRWGKIRRTEARAALGTLGVPIQSARFLGLPDQELTTLLLSGCRATLDRLIGIIEEWEPTLLLVPSVSDTHPDHNALAVISRFMLNELFLPENRMSVWSYVVHGRSRAFFDRALAVQCSGSEALVKANAIRCHKTQLSLSKKRFLAYARRPEHFCKLSSSDACTVDGPIAGISRQPDFLRIELAFSSKTLRPTQPAFLICGYSERGNLRGATVKLQSHSSLVELFDCHAMDGLGFGQYHGNRFEGELTIPTDVFSSTGPLFIKFDRRHWFFDEAGWIAIPPCHRRSTDWSHQSIEQFLAIR